MNKLTTERIKSFGVLAASLVTTANAVLALIGWNPPPFTDSQAGAAVSLALSVAVDVWAWWRQNVVTESAAVGHDVTARHKATAKLITEQTTGEPEQETNEGEANMSATIGLTESELSDIRQAWLKQLGEEGAA